VIALLLLQLAQDPLAVRADTIRQGHDALHYDITVVVENGTDHIVGEVETTWLLGSDRPVEVALDSAIRVVRVSMNGRENTRLTRTRWGRPSGLILIPHQGRAGDTISTRIRYHGTPPDGLIIGKNAYGAPTFFADNWPDRAHRWFPAQDLPGDKATVAFHVQAPLEYQVVANGVLGKIDTLAYGNAVWHYRMDRPIPVYTMVVGVARMVRTALPDGGCRITCVPVSVWTYPEDTAYAVTGPFRRAAGMVDYFSDLIGPFPYASLAHVESSTRFGGMENSSAIFYDEKAYEARRLSEETVAHETAHQWFGNAVTEADWHHLWLSEGFATYLATLWIGHADGDSAFAAVMRRHAQAIFAAAGPSEGGANRSPVTGRPILDPTVTDLLSLLNSNNYQKGAWVLHQLRGLVGDSTFVRGLRRYYETRRDGTALSADFARIMTETSGQDLDWYFRQALTQPGYPILEVRWKYRGKNRLALDIRQTQPGEWGSYRIPGLELLVDGTPVRVDVDGVETRQVVKGITRAPRAVQVNPTGWWLLQATVLPDE